MKSPSRIVQNAIRAAENARKQIKKGRFAGKYKDMTYAADYTKDRWFASRYGKDGTNVTEITVTGPYVTDGDGRERRHILYQWASGREIWYDRSPDVEACVREIMRGPNVVKQGDEAYAWNAVRNGRVEDKVRVTMDCFDFNGLRKVTKVMTLAALKQPIAQTKAPGATFDRVAYDIEKNGGTEVVIDPKVTIVAEWASRA